MNVITLSFLSLSFLSFSSLSSRSHSWSKMVWFDNYLLTFSVRFFLCLKKLFLSPSVLLIFLSLFSFVFFIVCLLLDLTLPPTESAYFDWYRLKNYQLKSFFPFLQENTLSSHVKYPWKRVCKYGRVCLFICEDF